MRYPGAIIIRMPPARYAVRLRGKFRPIAKVSPRFVRMVTAAGAG